jgi:hypothetical protein
MLMLLRRLPDRLWRVDEIATELGMSEPTVAASAAGLLAGGVLASETTEPRRFRYQPRTVALHAGVESLVAAYESDPLTVLKAVLNKPPRALRTFSDAFLFRRRRT